MRTRLLVALSLAVPVAVLPVFVGAQMAGPGQMGPGAMATPTPASPPPAERKLELTFHPDATVTLSAQNVPVRDILAEWRRKCACTIVNGERLATAASPVPMFFDHAEQSAVLDTLLRQAAGYTLTPQRAGAASPSRFETIYILATSTPSAGGYAAPSPLAAPITTPGNPDDEIAPVRQVPFIQNGPGQPQPPQPQGMQPQPQGQPQPQPQAPGAARPAGNSPFVPIVPIGGSSAPPPPVTGRGGRGGQ